MTELRSQPLGQQLGHVGTATGYIAKIGLEPVLHT